jgi:hypothetical protein
MLLPVRPSSTPGRIQAHGSSMSRQYLSQSQWILLCFLLEEVSKQWIPSQWISRNRYPSFFFLLWDIPNHSDNCLEPSFLFGRRRIFETVVSSWSWGSGPIPLVLDKARY